MRIAIGGISHESNTFNPLPTSIDSFAVTEGSRLLDDEAARFLIEMGVDVVPTLFARAPPSGIAQKESFLGLKDRLLAHLQSIGKIDGVCLILHGALEVEGIGSGEADLVKAVREIAGEEVPISASLDLHGNMAPEFVQQTNILTAIRTAPHRDLPETKVRAARLLLESLKNGSWPVSVMVNPPVLLPGELLVTDIEPALSLYQGLQKIDSLPSILNSSMFVGMAWSDTARSCATALVVAEDRKYEEKAYESVCELAEAYWDRRYDFHYEVEVGTAGEMIERAGRSSRRPVFISDSGDNVTAGAGGDIPLIVERMLAMGVAEAVVGGILDRESVELCKQAGVGARLHLEIGGKIDKVNGYPLEISGRVLNVADEGAVFRTDGVDIILTSRRQAFTSAESFRTYGIDVLARKIVVVKLGYLFSDLKKVAGLELIALTPGYTNLDTVRLGYKRVRRPLFPLDRDFSWEPPAAD